MGDLTYDPNEPRRPRPIASPFGVVPTPGFNVVDPQTANQGPGLMGNLARIQSSLGILAPFARVLRIQREDA